MAVGQQLDFGRLGEPGRADFVRLFGCREVHDATHDLQTVVDRADLHAVTSSRVEPVLKSADM